MDIGLTFLILGTIIIISFLANLFFKRTKIPEPLFLIIVGILLGSFVNVNQLDLLAIAPVMTSLVLIIILLDNGLEFNIFDTVKTVPSAFLFTAVVLLANVVLLGGLVHYMLGWPLLHALLFGTIIGGTTTDIVSILVKQLSLSHWTKQLLVLESIINDMQLIAFFVLLDLIQFQSTDISLIIRSIVLHIPVTILLGISFAVFWVFVLGKHIGNHPLDYAATVGILFVLYGLAQMIQGSGAIAVLTFSLILGNARRLMNRYKVSTPKYPKFTKKSIGTIKIVEMDVAFFIKSFFFVFLGLVFNIAGVTSQLLTISVLAIVLIVIVRYLGIQLIGLFTTSYKRDIRSIIFIMPRGYIAAVLGFLAIKTQILPDGLLTLILLNIFITTTLSILYAFYQSQRE